MSRYHADAAVDGLKDFQKATVAHVMDRFFGSQPTRRFLVADETGLGKSVVAGGVVARTLEALQDDDDVQRIDVIYVCSNQDIAGQNLERLNVAGGEAVQLSTRLTLLARDSHKLNRRPSAAFGKPLNLVAFTPGTSFDQGNRSGWSEERALLFLMLQKNAGWDAWQTRSAARALQGTIVETETFRDHIADLRSRLKGSLDPTIHGEFVRRATKEGQLERFDELIGAIGRRAKLDGDLRERCLQIIGELRTTLAHAGVEALEPDLIILDEFQRFRHLISPDGGDGAELARTLFDYGNARTLLLSATPYKPFSLADEAAGGDDHYQDFRLVLDFLCGEDAWRDEVAAALESYRDAAIHGRPTDGQRATLRRLLLRVMCRTERPMLGPDGMLAEHIRVADHVGVDDVRSFVGMRHLANRLKAPMSVEYWKSAPYFLNFVDGYRLGEKFRALTQAELDEVRPMLDSVRLLDARDVAEHRPIEWGNSRLRELAADTVDRGWWRLLWLPPSMPHYEVQGPFVDAARDLMTKRLLFSSWNATPTAVAALLSYEAQRRIESGHTGGDAARLRISRLDYRVEDGRAMSMSTLALFWPHPGLAVRCDPLAAARRTPESLPALDTVEQGVRADLLDTVTTGRHRAVRHPDTRHAGDPHPTDTEAATPWQAVLRWPDAVPTAGFGAVEAGEHASSDDAGAGFRRHVEAALALVDAADSAGTGPAISDDVVDDVVAIGMHGPGNIAWRALGRLRNPADTVTPDGHWRAAVVIAEAIRSLFNRTESALLIDQLDLDPVYWRAILRYCAAGGLQAVLDEYLHTLRSSATFRQLDDATLMHLAKDAAGAITIRSVTYAAYNPTDPAGPIRLTGRFALRYGGRTEEPAPRPGESAAPPLRQGEVRKAFNSPFWPFIVTTTSAGQEGIDFHYWCSAVVHWNIPANPVDFEQREGRVHRFGGHAIRRNMAAVHREAALRSSEPDVWKAAYDAARAASGPLGDFAPYWVYPGQAKIERHVFPYALSRDRARFDRLRLDLASYRLAFGQPRQEDMLDLIRARGGAEMSPSIDLRPGPD